MPEIASAKLSIRLELLPRRLGARVVDVGCGDGRHILEAARRGAFSVGVDYDPGELRKARERISDARVDLVAADATRLPFRDAAFDAVICTETLEHLPDDRGAVRELSRVLAPGGLLHGAVPSHFTELAYWALSRSYRTTPGGHVRIYRPRALKSLLRTEGLRVVQVRYVHFVDSVFWLRYCVADFLRPHQPSTPYEAAIMLAVAAERPLPTWRSRLRAAAASSRTVAALDTAGALIWPKSFTFVARKVR